MAPTYKVVLLGEGRVGKTSLVTRFLNGAFDEKQASTVQASMYNKKQVVVNEQCIPALARSRVVTTASEEQPSVPVSMNIWDTAGQERFHALGPIYYRNAHGALLVYDVTDTDTLDKVQVWITELRTVVGESIRLVICGNKSDVEKDREVTNEAGESFAEAHNAVHFSTSAKTGLNVEEAFCALAALIARDNGAFKVSGAAVATRGAKRMPPVGCALSPNPGSASNAATSAAGSTRRQRRGLRVVEDASGVGDEYSTMNTTEFHHSAALTSNDYIYDDSASASRDRVVSGSTSEISSSYSAGKGQAPGKKKPITLSANSGNRSEEDKRGASTPSGCCR